MSQNTFIWAVETRKMLVIALPIIAAQMLQVGMGTIDSIMAGKINALALASIALGSGIWSFVLIAGMGIMLSLPPTLSHHLGAKQMPLVREELRQGVWMALVLGGILILIVLGIVQIMPWFDVDPTIVPLAKEYVYWIYWSLPFSCLYLVPRALNEAEGFTMPMLWIQIITLPINILGNYLFMYGHWGFPAMGASGAALATGIAQVLGCTMLFAYTLTAKRYASYDLTKRMTRPDWRHIAKLVRLGLPIAVSLAAEVGLFATTVLLIGRFGVNTVAGHQIAMNIASLAFMIPLGISMASTIQVGHALGAKDNLIARQRGWLGTLLCGGFMLLSALNLGFFGEEIASLYSSDAMVITIATQLLVFAAIFQIVDGLQVGAVGALRGYKDTAIPMLMATVCYWLIGMGSGIYLGFYSDMGAKGLWIGLVLGLSSAAVLLNWRFQWLSRYHIEAFGFKQH